MAAHDNPYCRPAIDFLSRVAKKRVGHEWVQVSIEKFKNGRRVLLVDGQNVHPSFLDECCVDLSPYARFRARTWARLRSHGRLEIDGVDVDLEFVVS